MNRTVLTFFIVLCLSSTSSFSGLAFEIQPVKAVIGTVYIRADGTVEGTTSIQTADNITYVFLTNINASIDVERDNIIIDGEGYTVQGSWSGNGGGARTLGFYWSGISNVTVKNTNIKGFRHGISVGLRSLNNSISGNNITNNRVGINLRSSSNNNSISGNNIANNDNGVLLYSLNNSISGNNITNNGEGIGLCDSFKNSVSGNSITNNGVGVWFDCADHESISGNSITNNGVGICFDSSLGDPPSKYNSISGNSIANNGVGIDLGSSSNNNSISGNNFTASSSCGISLYSSSNTSISGNTFTDDGLDIFYSYQNFVEGNTVNGKPLVYLEDISDYSVSDAGQVILVNCDNIRVEGLNLSKASRGVQLLNTTNSIIARNTIANNYNGVWLDSSLNNSISGNNFTASNFYGISLDSSSNNNSISGNNIADNEYGIHLDSSSNSSVSGNNITNNEYGISICSSSDNNVYHNNFVENTLQVHSAGSINVWDDGYPSGGNYWSDYNGADVNRDGIGDTPYIIDGNNRDNHPLMTPYVPSEYLQFLCMRFLYYDLLGKYNELLKSIVGPNSTFNELSSNYGSLLVSFNGLNASYQQHLLNFSTLEANYTKLREDLDSLNTDYVSLDSSYQALNSSYNSLNASFNEYKASTQSELAYAKNLEYALTAITVILLVAIVYVVLRKPQTKSETQRPLQSTERAR